MLFQGLTFLFVILCSCSSIGDSSCLEGNGDVIQTDLELASFTSIIKDGVVNIVLSEGAERRVTFIRESNLDEAYNISVIGGVLRVASLTGDPGAPTCVNPTSALIVEIQTPFLDRVESSGTGDVIIESFDSSNNRIEIDKEGTGDVVFMGPESVDELIIRKEGTGGIFAFDVLVSRSEVTAEGTGDIEVSVNDELVVDRIGTGSVFYQGNPNLIINRNEGTGDIIKVD